MTPTDTTAQRRFSEVELEEILLAHHEAAHVVACLAYDIEFSFVTVIQSWWTGALTHGFTEVSERPGPNADEDEIDKQVTMMYAGLAAEEYWLADHPGHGRARAENGGGDTAMATAMMSRFPNCSGEPTLRKRALHLVASRWPQVVALAELLLVQHRVGQRAAKRAAR